MSTPFVEEPVPQQNLAATQLEFYGKIYQSLQNQFDAQLKAKTDELYEQNQAKLNAQHQTELPKKLSAPEETHIEY